MSCWFNHHFGFSCNIISSLGCIFAHVFPSDLCAFTSFQGAHLSHFLRVRTIHAPSLAYCTCDTLTTNKDILLSSMHNHGRGDTIRPTARTPIVNNVRSGWEFLLGRLLKMLAGQALIAFCH